MCRRVKASRDGGCSLLAMACLFMITLFLGVTGARATTEPEVKAAFPFNFIKSIDWPPVAFTNETAPIVVRVLGETPLQELLPQMVQDVKVKGRAVCIQSLNAGQSVAHCHLVFVARSEAAPAQELLRATKGKPVLTVGESPGIHLQRKNDQFRDGGKNGSF